MTNNVPAMSPVGAGEGIGEVTLELTSKRLWEVTRQEGDEGLACAMTRPPERGR